VRRYQSRAGLPVDGVAGPKTWAKLTALPKPPAAPVKAAVVASDRCVEFIASWEGFFPEVYNDPVGHCTIGYGTLLHLGPCTPADRRQWGTVTKQEARRLLKEELDPTVVNIVKNSPPLAQHQLDALASFAYNVGLGGYLESTLRRKLLAGDKAGAADEFLRWNKAGGRVLPGLTRRREAERLMFKDGVYKNNA
jgi:lysozyme